VDKKANLKAAWQSKLRSGWQSTTYKKLTRKECQRSTAKK